MDAFGAEYPLRGEKWYRKPLNIWPMKKCKDGTQYPAAMDAYSFLLTVVNLTQATTMTNRDPLLATP